MAKLFVVTGPSGAGKGTLIRALVGRRRDLEVAISATTRPQRPGEEDGRDYYFLTDEEFLRRIEGGDFLEQVVYVSGQRYGTLRSEIDRIHDAGKSCVLELETKGARAVKDSEPSAVTIFVSAPSFAELDRRLRERATESSGEIDERLELAREQMQEASDFDYVVLNDDVERAVTELDSIVTREAAGVGRLSAR
ncbi:MAG TPA: guanylate kinase [Gaiellaceae bacterium]|nr:guanylate kinase [Gaiellaceae bacterium]